MRCAARRRAQINAPQEERRRNEQQREQREDGENVDVGKERRLAHERRADPGRRVTLSLGCARSVASVWTYWSDEGTRSATRRD